MQQKVKDSPKNFRMWAINHLKTSVGSTHFSQLAHIVAVAHALIWQSVDVVSEPYHQNLALVDGPTCCQVLKQ